MGLLTLVLSLVLLSVQLSWTQKDPLFPFSEHLDPEHKVRLRWGFDEIQTTFLFELTVNTIGWVGLGFSPNGGMAGADIVIGGVGPHGIYFTDRHAVGNSAPLVDQQQNYELLSLSESNGQTIMKFQRPFDSCDPDDFPISTRPLKLIYAYGLTDDIMYHDTRRGTKEINLLRYMPKVTLRNSKFFDMIMADFKIPERQTYYHCKVMSAPAFDKKQHIYRIEPLIQNVDIVHHMLLYRCPPSVTATSEGECYIGGKNEACTEGIAVWAVGGEPFEFPEVAGLPIGEKPGEVLYRLEIHYNNQNKVAGRVDSSGLRFHYTSELRQHDAAILGTGLGFAPGYAIPPKAKAFLTYGMCDTSYFQQVLPGSSQDLQVFAVMPHTHLAGRKVRVGQFRDGEQIDLLAVDEYYNFEYQQTVHLGKTKTVKLGDTLVVQCTYNTEDRTKPTWGGLSTQEEMCMATLFYYPAMSLSSCMSFPDHDALRTEMGTTDYSMWFHMMSTRTWKDAHVNNYQQTLKKVKQFLIIFDPFLNASLKADRIPELTVKLSQPCRSRCDAVGFPWMSVFFCLVMKLTI